MATLETSNALFQSVINLDKAESILQAFREDAFYDMPELTAVQQASNTARHEMHSNLLDAAIDYIRTTREAIGKLDGIKALEVTNADIQ